MKRQILYSPLSAKATKIMLLGAGELGKEVIIEAMRLGFFTIAVDRYEGAPGQQVAHRSYTGSLKDAAFLRSLIEKEKPDYIVPEIEAINLDMLFDLEKEGFNIIPNAKATYTAMQRERIRELIVKTGVPVSEYYYASSLKELKAACKKAGFPCWVKAIQDSSGAGSSKVKSPLDIEKAYERAQVHARGSAEKLIVEKNIDFDLEVTELVVRYFVNGSPRFAGEAGSLAASCLLRVIWFGQMSAAPDRMIPAWLLLPRISWVFPKPACMSGPSPVCLSPPLKGWVLMWCRF
ncbi:MAG: Phosphoribosylglycinamide formyltransferase 2 [Candidatus Daviesbacteria bacterium GW2011_GWB1_39_5]|nr:MAG: Phosphoribosylglycinamide formyltransferase 2 [Candidatus Daviesbacteria bacterium GW2011_GWB1_39_5]